ncbi:hypothetical protein [Polynucleobacter sp. AP-Latsch-80-C2]|uniref:hypothetical protein n=1 Tax=Polynucleobacter sp. AP-Latsch-80-C2 TaxID=2576931 RepID=UPI001C0AE81B|nr:hypothetical protein [Polynucleobacter sp. AP-Latsch-80-C2]MBU3624384.1 hypothetical protein [Polynucleobacter sp. AP-Latsch-80-C2]
MLKQHLNTNYSFINLKLFFQLFFMITVLFVFIPFKPGMPSDANPLDPSWILGVNYAVSKGWVFGRDFMFTFGPFASIYSKGYYPATDDLMMFGAAYLAILYMGAALYLARECVWYVVAILVAATLFLSISPDALLLSYALLVAIFTFKTAPVVLKTTTEKNQLTIFTAILFSAFGLYPLIKGTLFVLYFIVAFCSIAILFYYKKWLTGVAVFIAILMSTFFFWGYSGQSLVNLPGYFLSMSEIISGYSEAMMISGDISEIFAYLLVSLVLLVTISKIDSSKVLRLYLGCVYLIYLFISFKSGFVRHDAHALISANALLYASLLLVLVAPIQNLKLSTVASMICAFFIGFHYLTLTGAITYLTNTYEDGLVGLVTRYQTEDRYTLEYEHSLTQIKSRSGFPDLHGSVDSIPINQAKLISNGYDWQPRPIFQSYAAYNPALATRNYNYLLGSNAPENIIFQVSTIDDRYPSLDDGLSWQILLSNYHPIKEIDDFIFLKRNKGINAVDSRRLLLVGEYVIGKKVIPPKNNGLVYMQLDIEPTLSGRLLNIFFKSSELRMMVYLKSGAVRNYRIIPSMAKTGFILSPLIENSVEFSSLFLDPKILAPNEVESFAIYPENKAWAWKQAFKIQFSEFNFPLKSHKVEMK